MDNKKIFRKTKSTEFILLVILVAMAACITVATIIVSGKNNFFTGNNVSNIVRQTSINGVIALGMTIVIISAGIDLSVGAVVGFSGVLVALLMQKFGMAPLAAIVITIPVSTLIGLFNGIVIYDGKVPPFIATLGTMTAVRGLIMLITNARMVSGLPKSFTNFAQMSFLGIPALFLVWLAIILLTAFIVKYTRFGRNVYAIGSNMEAARLSGINVRLATYGVYVYCAFLCSIAGIMMTTRLGNGVPTGGTGFETDAIASAVIGGASLAGAEGTVLGTILGAIIMQTFRNGGNLLGINSHLMEVVIGLLIIGAVLLDKRRKGRAV